MSVLRVSHTLLGSSAPGCPAYPTAQPDRRQWLSLPISVVAPEGPSWFFTDLPLQIHLPRHPLARTISTGRPPDGNMACETRLVCLHPRASLFLRRSHPFAAMSAHSSLKTTHSSASSSPGHMQPEFPQHCVLWLGISHVVLCYRGAEDTVLLRKDLLLIRWLLTSISEPIGSRLPHTMLQPSPSQVLTVATASRADPSLPSCSLWSPLQQLEGSF